MNKVPFERPQEFRRRNGAAYTCTDGVRFHYGYKVFEIDGKTTWKIDLRGTLAVPKNGILLRFGKPTIVIATGTLMSRNMKKIIRGGPAKTYAFPNTITIVGKSAFYKNVALSVRLNEGLRVLENNCFESSGIRKLALPASVESIDDFAFASCGCLDFADLRAARGLKCIGNFAFNFCMALKQVLLNDGLETIGEECFEKSGLEQVSIPSSMSLIHTLAFSMTPLTQMCFLGTTGNGPCSGSKQHAGCLSSDTKDSHLQSEHRMVIGEEAFSYCTSLRQVVFEPGSAVEEIQCKAFYCSGLEFFIAPPSLRKIGIMAFRECCNLKKFELNEGIQELGWLYLWRTGVTDLHIPPHINMTREQLGLDQDPKELRLPDGLEAVGAWWFADSDIEKVFIPSTVREIEYRAFFHCEKLREVVFAPDSQLETIGQVCFYKCGLEEMVIPKSVRSIGDFAFRDCRNLRSLTFEEGNQLIHVGRDIVSGTQLTEKDVEFPERAQVERGRE